MKDKKIRCSDCGKVLDVIYKRKSIMLVDKKRGSYQVAKVTYVCKDCV